MLTGLKEVLIITTPDDLPRFRELLDDGSQLGLSLYYAEQPRPEGLAQSFIIGRRFLGNENVCLILGDNIFYGDALSHNLRNVSSRNEGATVFGYWVRNPERYGVASFDDSGRVVCIVDKSSQP